MQYFKEIDFCFSTDQNIRREMAATYGMLITCQALPIRYCIYCSR